MRLKYVSAALALSVLLPFAASALSVDDIQAQIQSLLAQIAQLQQQLKQIQNPTPVIHPPAPPICPTFTRTLAQGASGEDVTQLQQSLGVSATGYFGPMTAKAVAAVQADAGLSQVGIVGPATRAWFWKRCGGEGWNQNFSASPTSGTAPLSVNFQMSGRGNDSYSIDFGDGISGPMTVACLSNADVAGGTNNPAGGCASFANHTYTANGTYTAKLIYQPPMPACPTGMYCAQAMPMPQTIGSVTIYVGSSTSGGAPVVTGVDGPASLAVGQQGTWTGHASVSGPDTNLRYSVIWGDEGVFNQISTLAGNAPTALQTAGSFTHAYARAGTYRPVFTVSNSLGSAQTSASVQVGGSTTNTFSAYPTSGAAPLSVI